MGDEIPGVEAGESASFRRPARASGMQISETKRAEAIGACIKALVEELGALASEDRALERFLCELRKVDPGRDRRDEWEQAERPSPGSLDRALSDVPPGWKVGNAVLSVAPLLDWRQVFKSNEIDPHLQTNLTMASLAVRRGGPGSQSLFVGLFLLAPHTSYPLHSHTAPEVYYCVSGRLSLQHGIDGKPFPLLPGEYSITPSERLHALRTDDGPVLLIYVWLQGPDSENWWWAQEPDGSWKRSAWQWQSDGRWVRTGCEVIGAETMRKGSSQYRGTE